MPQGTEIKKLHPTLKKCGCGFIGNKGQFYEHMDNASQGIHSHVELATKFYKEHGEVPINEDEGDTFLNARWLKGTPKGYND